MIGAGVAPLFDEQLPAGVQVMHANTHFLSEALLPRLYVPNVPLTQ
jgi:hypothetical protein